MLLNSFEHFFVKPSSVVTKTFGLFVRCLFARSLAALDGETQKLSSSLELAQPLSVPIYLCLSHSSMNSFTQTLNQLVAVETDLATACSTAAFLRLSHRRFFATSELFGPSSFLSTQPDWGLLFSGYLDLAPPSSELYEPGKLALFSGKLGN